MEIIHGSIAYFQPKFHYIGVENQNHQSKQRVQIFSYELDENKNEHVKLIYQQRASIKSILILFARNNINIMLYILFKSIDMVPLAKFISIYSIHFD